MAYGISISKLISMAMFEDGSPIQGEKMVWMESGAKKG
jgi:hypothetical protein